MPTGLGGEKLWLCPTLDDSANDLSGNSNNGTYNGGMVTVADTGNGGTRAYDFDGSNDYISVPFILDPSQKNFTFSAWVNLETSSGDYQIIAQQEGTFGRSWLHNNASYDSGGKRLATSLSGGSSTISSFTFGSGQEGNWYHVAITCTPSGQTEMWVDGTSYGGNVNNTIEPSTSGMRFGNHKNTLSYGWNGLIDDIRIFDRVLNTTEITHLATSRGIEGSPYTYSGLGDEKLWLCPSLDDSADDISGNGNHGTYYGGMGTVADVSNGGTRAYSFDGNNDYLDFGDILDTEVWTAGDFAISGWIKTNGLNTVQVLNKYHNISGNRQFHLRVIYSGGNLKLNAYIHTTLNNAEYRFWEGSTNLNANTWYHVALNYDASASSNDRASCFINGSSETMTVTQSSGTLSTIPDGSASLAIGARVSGASASDFRTGYSDDIRIFDRALSTSEITSLASKRGYEVPAAPSGSTPHPLSAPIFHPLG